MGLRWCLRWFDFEHQNEREQIRDDLIRFVVGMQWRELCGPSGPEVNPGADLRPACDIVDEWLWLGVR